MFTGIVEEVGRVRRTEGGELVIECHTILDGSQLGDSIAVNGVDLTVRAMDHESMTFDVMPETFRRSNLADVQEGEAVNLERSVTAATRLSGHIVRGVVETTCRLHSFTPEGDAIIARFETDAEHLKYIAMKGPVCVDGISLTVMAKDATSFSVSLVQYTQEHTNLMQKQPGASINLETDIMARYVEQILEARATTMSASTQ
ncbi:MAG: riboflavin synthase [Chloroflexi bacterium]|nr:riboflavin synthase [Chloroflexota bacterium]MDA1241347.1 riboflavin synthase [Chloroflexota bacterium]